MKVATKRDLLDVEQLRELGTNAGYRMVAERMRVQLHRATKDLTFAKSWDETRYLQGEIAALTMALGIPDLLVTEMKTQIKASAQ